jgi:ankyrin repeat protein
MAANDAGLAPDLTIQVYARRLARWQRDGYWVTSDFRPPHSSSLFMTTATAVRAISVYMPPELRDERDTVIHNARKWLFDNRPLSTEDASFRLMGLVWAGGAEEQLKAAAHDLLSMQKAGGGWSQLPDYQPDAYSTGEALFALDEMPENSQATVAARNKGIRFLLSTQASDGTWRVHTRMLSPAEVSPKYFSTGFPYGKDEFLSYAGSCWAVMALARMLKPGDYIAGDPGRITRSWMPTALFGPPQQLESLLKDGLDPNTKTENGTTLLMASVLDPAKIKLLIARGADVKFRSASGTDALTVASAYRGTAASITALLDAGAEVEPPEGVRARNTALVFASMTGDLDNVKLLLSRGARPAEKAFSQAVTFGYSDVVQTLIAAGADTKLTDGSGVNLLHWAAIADRPLLVSILAEAHVPINATDNHGFTPLMYAATIDFGDDDVLKALLKAGADKSIRNFEGRTPLGQAKYYKHSHLEQSLR